MKKIRIAWVIYIKNLITHLAHSRHLEIPIPDTSIFLVQLSFPPGTQSFFLFLLHIEQIHFIHIFTHASLALFTGHTVNPIHNSRSIQTYSLTQLSLPKLGRGNQFTVEMISIINGQPPGSSSWSPDNLASLWIFCFGYSFHFW